MGSLEELHTKEMITKQNAESEIPFHRDRTHEKENRTLLLMAHDQYLLHTSTRNVKYRSKKGLVNINL